jgi:hypothetical protein
MPGAGIMERRIALTWSVPTLVTVICVMAAPEWVMEGTADEANTAAVAPYLATGAQREGGAAGVFVYPG